MKVLSLQLTMMEKILKRKRDSMENQNKVLQCENATETTFQKVFGRTENKRGVHERWNSDGDVDTVHAQ